MLTPGHFLLGKQLQAMPEHNLTNDKLPLLRRWHMCQAMSQYFLRCWSNEYIQQLQRLSRWKTQTRNFQENDLILVKEDSVFNTHCPMGRVVSTFPGKDGLVRVAMIHTQKGTYKRLSASLFCSYQKILRRECSPLVGRMLELKKKMSYTAPKARARVRSTQDIPYELY